MNAPVVLFVYNRPQHTSRTIASLAACRLAKDTPLFIFSDAAKKSEHIEQVNEVRRHLQTISEFANVQIVEREKNYGLARSIIEGVTQVINQYGRAIVIEDDLILSINFLEYMNACLDAYQQHRHIFSISAYRAPIEIPSDYEHDIFLFRRINSWGWATWADRWTSVDWQVSDFDTFIRDKKQRAQYNLCGNDISVMLLRQIQGNISSWAVRFNYACYKQGATNVYPVVSKVINAGADGSGQHVGSTQRYSVALDNGHKPFTAPPLPQPDSRIEANYKQFFDTSHIRRLINFFKIRKYIYFKK